MSDVLVSLCGSMGDNLFRVPVARQLVRQYGRPVDLVLDEGSRVLVSLLARQEWTDRVFTSPGITGYPLGGQPFDFGRDAEWRRQYTRVHHLGYRWFPRGNFTLETAQQAGLTPAPDLLTVPSLARTLRPPRYLCVHIDASAANEPARNRETEATLRPVFAELCGQVERVFFLNVGRPVSDYVPYVTAGNVTVWNDGGDLQRTVELLEESVLVGTYSSMWALMNLLKGPQAVVMDGPAFGDEKLSSPAETRVRPGDSEGLLRAFAHQWQRAQEACRP